jgi:predicted dehydrogenase
MIDIGVLGLDTSHPESFASVLTERPDVAISAVWDSGTVRDSAYVNSFCEEYGVERYDDSEALVDVVDVVMVLTVDWNAHTTLAVPFLEAGIPTLIDKPIAGRLSAIETLEQAAGDTPLFGGSAIPFHPTATRLPLGGDNRTLFVAGYNDYFYYRVHLSDTVRLLADSDWVSVESVGGPGTTVLVTFENGTHATMRYDGTPDEGTFGILDVGTQTRAIEISSGEDSFSRLYESYLSAFLDAVHGVCDTHRILDSARLALAVEITIEQDRSVTPESQSLETIHVSSDRFVSDYKPYY